MPETLLSPSQILLYGKVLQDISITRGADQQGNVTEEEWHRPFVQERGGQNQFLDQQVEDPDSRFARIYGFSYEGNFYELPRPMIFLVHGPGAEADPQAGGDKKARAPDDPDRSGVAAASFSYSENVKVWSYDKGDFSLRMDLESGPFEQILLEYALESEGTMSSYSGARVSGARVSGARVSGARVSGARVSGARVGGGNTGD